MSKHDLARHLRVLALTRRRDSKTVSTTACDHDVVILTNVNFHEAIDDREHRLQFGFTTWPIQKDADYPFPGLENVDVGDTPFRRSFRVRLNIGGVPFVGWWSEYEIVSEVGSVCLYRTTTVKELKFSKPMWTSITYRWCRYPKSSQAAPNDFRYEARTTAITPPMLLSKGGQRIFTTALFAPQPAHDRHASYTLGATERLRGHPTDRAHKLSTFRLTPNAILDILHLIQDAKANDATTMLFGGDLDAAWPRDDLVSMIKHAVPRFIGVGEKAITLGKVRDLSACITIPANIEVSHPIYDPNDIPQHVVACGTHADDQSSGLVFIVHKLPFHNDGLRGRLPSDNSHLVSPTFGPSPDPISIADVTNFKLC